MNDVRTIIQELLFAFYLKLGTFLGFNGGRFPSVFLAARLKIIDEPIVIDVGCNVGDFVDLIASISHKPRVYCFDIQETFGDMLKKNHPDLNIFFCHVALSDKPGVSKFFSNSKTDRKAHLVSQDMSQGTSEEVVVSTLDREVARLGINRVDVLKIDTEGFDFEVLRGAKKTLGFTQTVIFEIMFRTLERGVHPNDYLAYLSSHGFNYFYRCTAFLGLHRILKIDPWHLSTQTLVASRNPIR